jgi:molybdate transport system substrate-binding protein
MFRAVKNMVKLVLSVLSLISIFGCAQSSQIVLNVSAAASLTDAIKEINSLYTSENPQVSITPNFASSGTLQQQIENGAPCDVFISAAVSQMDNLQNKQLILNDTRRNLLNNSVVLIVPAGSTLGITSFNDLTQDKVKKIAIGDPGSVPAGTYAKQTFDLLGIASTVQSKLVLAGNVRQVLTYVENGDVDAGIVYSTDSLISNSIKVVASAPAEINANIVYPVAVIKSSKNLSAANKYMDFISNVQAKAIFEKYGFTLASK